MRQALEARHVRGYSLTTPLCVYELCSQLEIELRFAELGSIEGVYSKGNPDTILINSQRPSGRQVFTCAHELGHRILGHGSRIDGADYEKVAARSTEAEEYLANLFAGILLMPKVAMRAAFDQRGWSPESISPEQALFLACAFGVSYESVITHLSIGLEIISPEQRKRLAEHSVRRIVQNVLTTVESTEVVLVDQFWSGRPIDVAVGNLISAAMPLHCEGASVARFTAGEKTYLRAIRPGISRVFSDNGWSAFARVSRPHYVGRLQFRHLEDPDFNA